MRRFVGFTAVMLLALAAPASAAWACQGSHHEADWACLYDTKSDFGYCQQNPIPAVDAPEDTEVLPEVPDLAPLVEQYVVPLIPGKRL